MQTFSNLMREQYIAIAILMISSCVVIWVTIPLWKHQNLNDDSYITLTYSKNLVAGKGFIYNHPPTTLGTTTPLFTFLTAFLTVILPVFTVAKMAILVSVVAWLGVVWVLYLIMHNLTIPPVPSAIISSISLLTAQVWTIFIGMEIWLFQFLLVLSTYLVFKKKLFHAGVTAAALFLTRGEGVLVGLILFGYLWFREQKMPTPFMFGAASILAVWIIYALIVFGTFIPNSLAAKQAQAQLPGGRYFIERILLELIPNHIRRFAVFRYWFLNPYLILIGLGLVYIIRQKRILLLFIGWILGYLITYTILNPSPYFWYVLHVVFILQLMAGVGLAWLIMLVRKTQSQLAQLATSLVIIGLALTMLYPSLHYIIFQSQHYLGDQRAMAYKAIADWLNKNTNPEDSIAFIEIGYLGYFTDNKIIDLAGLTDPLITNHLVTDGFTWGFWHYKPDYYIYAEEFNWALSDIEPALDDYTIVHHVQRDNFPTPIYILKRNTD